MRRQPHCFSNEDAMDNIIARTSSNFVVFRAIVVSHDTTRLRPSHQRTPRTQFARLLQDVICDRPDPVLTSGHQADTCLVDLVMRISDAQIGEVKECSIFISKIDWRRGRFCTLFVIWCSGPQGWFRPLG